MKGLLKAMLAATVALLFILFFVGILMGALFTIEKEFIEGSTVTQMEIPGGRFWEMTAPDGTLIGNATTCWKQDGRVDFKYYLNEAISMPPSPPVDPEIEIDREGTIAVILILFGVPFAMLTTIMYVIQNL